MGNIDGRTCVLGLRLRRRRGHPATTVAATTVAATPKSTSAEASAAETSASAKVTRDGHADHGCQKKLVLMFLQLDDSQRATVRCADSEEFPSTVCKSTDDSGSSGRGFYKAKTPSTRQQEPPRSLLRRLPEKVRDAGPLSPGRSVLP
ncbi:unnamed protein product, partial [Ixodes persulcatus]